MCEEFEPTTNTNIHIFYLFLPHPPLHSLPPPTPPYTHAHLCFSPYSDMPNNGGIRSLVQRLLNAEICKSVFSKYGSCVHVSSHKPTITKESLENGRNEMNYENKTKSKTTTMDISHANKLPTLPPLPMDIIHRALYLFRGETFHIGGVQDVLQVVIEIADVCADRDFIFPFKVCPHLSELCVGAVGWHDVVHDINVDVVQHHAVTIRRCARHVVH